MSLKASKEKLMVGSSDKSLFRTLQTDLARLKRSGSGTLKAPLGKDDQPLETRNTLREKERIAREKLQQLHHKFEQDSYTIIFEIMPGKIKQLDELFKDDANFKAELDTIGQPPSIQKAQKEGESSDPNNSIVECNSIILYVEKTLKMEILEMKEFMSTLSIWIQLNIPRIQDGNNFGVEVQSEMINVLDRAGESSFEILTSFTDYHLTRAAILTKVLKYPGLQDYMRSITELDERFYIKATSLLLDLRNTYFVLFDSVSKNLAKIESPRPKEEPTFIY